MVTNDATSSMQLQKVVADNGLDSKCVRRGSMLCLDPPCFAFLLSGGMFQYASDPPPQAVVLPILRVITKGGKAISRWFVFLKIIFHKINVTNLSLITFDGS